MFPLKKPCQQIIAAEYYNESRHKRISFSGNCTGLGYECSGNVKSNLDDEVFSQLFKCSNSFMNVKVLQAYLACASTHQVCSLISIF